jgi:DnaJ-domain-containing protein 1
MQYLLLGLLALLLFLLLARAYTMASPQVLVRQLRIGVGVAVIAGAFFLVLRGAVGYATSLAALGAWLLWGGGVPWGDGGAQQSAGRVSRVRTEHLEMELEHDTGRISGSVLKGAFAGRALESLSPMETARLWQECRFADLPSAQILEAYLDRAHPSWRDDMGRFGADGGAEGGRMTRRQALEVLGLREGASEEDIRRAHRELMMKMHPDRGGSTFLAAKINEAKDVLLG